jgi:CRISPR-associated protein Csa3
MENYLNTSPLDGSEGLNLKVLISTLYNPDPVLLACTRLSPDRLILLIDQEPDKKQKEALDLIQKSLGRVLDIKAVKIPVYDVVGIAKEVVKIIDLQPKNDEIYFNITAGRKTQSMGVLFGAYARSCLVKKIAYNPEEDKAAIVYLPILSFKLNESQLSILTNIDKKTIESYSDLVTATGLSSAMVYRSIDELRNMDFVEITDDGFKLTDAGKIARL